MINNSSTSSTSGITIESVKKSFGRKTILSDISLNIGRGMIYGLLGPSGCGKSTLVKMIAGISNPDCGRITILGKEMPDFSCMQQVGYMAQSAALYPTLSAYENLDFFGSLYIPSRSLRKERIHEVASLVNLTADLKKPISAFSGGMKQRLSLAITLLPKPAVLLLDEPTVGIDPLLRQAIWKQLRLLRDEGVTILVTTHVMDEVNQCDELTMLREGSILISGSVKSIIIAAGTTTMEEAFVHFSEKQENGGYSYAN
ncbi:ABC transporter ATP-binding protein [Anaerosporobacter faecicola]|uniref:ABC transporter ATP-binding protein n=1 Tax=Anaerosporobacter faecicola TaxID=2718714 RepID=UPI00143BA00D|nr:ABC transporter ATP-binding protein [Anaerosporobacter faecicola]